MQLPGHATDARDLRADPRHRREVPPHVPRVGELVELDGFAGQVVDVRRRQVSVRDRRGRTRHFTLDGRLAWVDDAAVRLQEPPRPAAAAGPRTTPSGSLATGGPRRARVARAGRIWVEGLHDAVLVEAVWGDDLRDAGVVVEPLHGIDDLAAAVTAFRPGPHRRLGVLVDHLVDGSKESRWAARVDDPHVLVTGHPYVDVWAAVRPAVLGIQQWPDVPHGIPWKVGVARALGVEDPTTLWRRVAAAVTSWRDLEQPLVRAVERLLDHVTAEDHEDA